MYDAVIPAGGTIDGEYRERAGTHLRALAPIGKDKRPVLQIVVDALRNGGRVGNIIVVGDPSLNSVVNGVDCWMPEAGPDETAELGAGPANVLRGLSELPPDRPALVCTSDLPFLTSEAVAAFLGSIDRSVGMSAGLVPARMYEERYPGAPPSQYVQLRETGPIAMGCLFHVVPSALLANAGSLNRAFAARKSQFGSAKLLGLRLVCQYAMGRLSLVSVQRRIEDILRCRVGVATDAMPELAFDIDTVEDYSYASSRV